MPQRKITDMTRQQAIFTLKLMLILYVWRAEVNDNNGMAIMNSMHEDLVQSDNIIIIVTAT